MMWKRFKNWYLGGDPNSDAHRIFRNVGMSPIPGFRERERLQEAARLAELHYAHKAAKQLVRWEQARRFFESEKAS